MSDYRNMNWYDGPEAEPIEEDASQAPGPEGPGVGRGPWIAAAAAGVIAIGGLGLWLASHNDSPPPPAASSTATATPTPSRSNSSTSASSSSTSWPVVHGTPSKPGNTTSAGGESNKPSDEEQKKRDQGAKDEAMTVMRLFAHPDLSKDEWFNALKPHMDGDFAESMRYTDPATITAHKVTGEAVVRPMYATDAREVAIPTDSGVWTVSMTYDTTANRWVASAVSMPGDEDPGDH